MLLWLFHGFTMPTWPPATKLFEKSQQKNVTDRHFRHAYREDLCLFVPERLNKVTHGICLGDNSQFFRHNILKKKVWNNSTHRTNCCLVMKFLPFDYLLFTILIVDFHLLAFSSVIVLTNYCYQVHVMNLQHNFVNACRVLLKGIIHTSSWSPLYIESIYTFHSTQNINFICNVWPTPPRLRLHL